MTIFWFIVLLGPLVFFHELGHFLTAKMFNVKVLSFSLGFGPILWKKQWGETEYRLSAIPLGGYVGMIGEDPNEELSEEDAHRTLSSLSLWKKLLVVIAGPLVNLIIPILIFFFYYLTVHQVTPPLMGTVLPGTAANKAGINSGDLVLSVNGKNIESFNQFRRIVKSSPNKKLKLKLKSTNGTIKEATITPTKSIGLNLLGLKQSVGRAGVLLNSTVAIVGIINTTSEAYQKGIRTGDQIISIEYENKKYPIKFWAEYQSLIKKISNSKPIKIQFLTESSKKIKHLGTSIAKIKTVELSSIKSLSDIEPGELYISSVTKGGAADKWGITPNSRVAGIRIMQKDEKFENCKPETKPIRSYSNFEEKLFLYPNKRFCITWITPSPNGKCYHTAVLIQDKLQSVDKLGHKRINYEIGMVSWRKLATPDDVPVKNQFLFAVNQSFTVTWDLTVGMIKGIYFMFSGKVESENLGGVIAIAQMAKLAADRGFFFFLQMMAILSLNFFLLNLLPIPVLDGGQALLFTIEAIIKKPITMKVRTVILYIGIGLVLLIMIYGFRNDLVRVFRHETKVPETIKADIVNKTNKGLLSPQPQNGATLPCIKP